jgi:N-acetylmuramoyl-L-alanine amidase
MRADRIPTHEADFLASGRDSSGKVHSRKPFTVTIPGTSEQVAMINCKRADGDQSFFYRTEAKKERIVLHYTAGYLKGDIGALTATNTHVSTPFVIARDGTILNLWASKYWSYHLGQGAQGGNEKMSRTGIGIELSNIGWLTRDGSDLVTYFSRPASRDVYCTLDQRELYHEVPAYRGYTYFATHTAAQYESLVKLLRFLSATYSIPLAFLAESERYGVVQNVSGFRGVTSHVNYRAQGKWDIGPAFEWERVIRGCGGRVAAPTVVTAPPA